MSEPAVPQPDLQEIVRPPGNPVLRVLFILYYRVLDRIEWGVLIALLALVIGLSFIEILNRNFGLTFWDSAATNLVVYALTFYLGLYGAVLATRKLKHIRIDAVTPYLSRRAAMGLDVAMALVGALACAWLAVTAMDFIERLVDADDRFLPDKVEWYWRTRVWKWPAAVAFWLMALHFVVAAGERVLLLVRGQVPAGTKTRPVP